MSHQKFMRLFAKWHIWLGWLVGFPILMWTVTGLIMVWHPIEYVRGNHLRAELPAVETGALVMPQLTGPVQSVTLQSFPDGPGWIVIEEDGGRFRYSPEDGRLYNPVSEDHARSIAEAAYAGDAALEAITYFPADAAPMDLRTPVNSWQARFADDTHIYIHTQTGEVLAVRSGWWRVFDFMWGLHIMDLETREDTSHPILILFAALGVIGSLLGCVLMFRRRKAKVKA
ncbi:PepSY domain-containing protein [Aurantiacibacter sp. MUD11]|uniref:PepSY domain-containing protein n=1 Tax=Aurantiacibacter sp. MUD11 TaxID=3003265 RepID=UPI0022AA50C7|nr:PepSY domain-containing protein [Aurantiacibacter sp. MUD11]WAT17978.1 PepSY domain-containing protein [Aurantiacibacter sp. MUD11]